MSDLVKEIGCVHFIGLGGIGMSGIAEFMFEKGFKVQGSNDVENNNTKRLSELGIPVFIGQKADNLKNADVVCYSTAISDDNPEMKEARKQKIPVLHRGEMLAEIMKKYNCISVAGTHGKTTTTGMIFSVLEACGMDSNVIIGGILNSIHANMKTGSGNWMVAEADESDGTFLKLPSTNIVITNIDPEHLNYYGDYQNMLRAFMKFAEQIPFYGGISLCYDHPRTREMAEKLTHKKVMTYGLEDGADVQAFNIRVENHRQIFDVRLKQEGGRVIPDVTLQVFGTHNILNALAALTQGLFINLAEEEMLQGLQNFTGVERRFSHLGKFCKADVYDDYAHHPTEIKSVLTAAKSIAKGKVFVVFQPHRYTRVYTLMKDFATCFQGADYVMITPIYAAGEKPIEGIDHHVLCQNIKKTGFDAVETTDNIDLLADTLAPRLHEGDIVLCLGAGSISAYAHKLVQNATPKNE